MANQRLMKKVAPVVLSAAVVMTSMPATAFAADFSDTEVTELPVLRFLLPVQSSLM